MDTQAAADLADWLVYLELEGKSDRTLYAYPMAIKPLLLSHPGKGIDEFTTEDINNELRLVPPRSRHISRSIYNRWFEWALLMDKIEKTPMARVPKMREPRRRPKDIFSEAEIELLETLPAPDGALWTILFKTGLRRGEARRLRKDHVNLNRARLIVHEGKGGKDRLLPIPPAALMAIADLELLERMGDKDYFWYRKRYETGDPRRRAGPIGDTTFELWYKRGIEQANVRYLNPHTTRHTYGWWLRTNHFDLEERQLLMGHESSATTEKYYGRLTIDDVADKVAVL